MRSNGLATTAVLDPTDRILVKIFLNNNDNTNRTVTFYTEGTQHYSYIITTLGVKSSSSGTSGTDGSSGISGANGTSGTNGTSEIGRAHV